MTRPTNTELPDRIIDAAEGIVVESGHEALNMRLVADRVGVTPTTLYYYYKSKEHILRELKLRAARMLNAGIRDVDRSAGSGPALLALGEAYIRFAEQNPQLYRLLVEVKLGTDVMAATDYDTLCFSYYAAREMLESMARIGERKFDPAALAMIGWVLLHGFSSLLVAGTLETVTGFDREDLRSAFLEFYAIEDPCLPKPETKDTKRKRKGGQTH
jgi:AcrR family transcriptional regulator